MRMSTIAVIFFAASAATANADLVHQFRNPSFNGQGFSNHVLSIEQLRYNREESHREAAEAEARRIERELENSTLNRFLRNVESRIYATISKQMVDAMFADCSDSCASTGTAEIEGSTITWTKDETTGAITLEVVSDDGTTTITIPGAGEFNF